MLSLFKSKKTESHQLTLEDDTFFTKLRNAEYSRLDKEGHAYLDYTGGNLYTQSQIQKHQALLRDNVYGNPHSTNPTSHLSTILVEDARKKILSFFNATDYHCIFTSNASGALKIVGESFPFNEKSSFVILADNHNSVNGIREYCTAKNGKTTYIPVQYEDLEIKADLLEKVLSEADPKANNLFAYPAQSNVSGVKHDLAWIEKAQKKGFDVLLDAAAYVPSSKLDLSVIKPDFVSISFYKIFGYPTGIGCLLVKKSSFDKLVKPWFAGGTVTMVSVVSPNKFLVYGSERFEDGTLNYLGIPAVTIGLDYIESIGMERISKRVLSLIENLSIELKKLKHDTGKYIVKIFGPDNFKHHGGTLIMNFFDPEGKLFPFEKIEAMANAKKISIRSGCFCNPGIDEINNCVTTEELANYFVSRDKGDYHDIVAYLGKMRGAIRVSVGIASNGNDLMRFVELISTLKNKAVKDL